MSATLTAAQSCGGVYTVERGDTLSAIALAHYKNASLWAAIHTANIGWIGDDPDNILIGQQLYLACINGRPGGLLGAVTTASPETDARAAPDAVARTSQRRPFEANINLVTASDDAPFADPELPGGGLITELVQAALDEGPAADRVALHWIDDRAAHLDPLMSQAMMDMAFPWPRPDCAPDIAPARACTDYHYSPPLFEMLVLLFVDRTRPIPFASDADLVGRTLCRPEGLATHDLDRPGRAWLERDVITLVQPASVRDCFDLLLAGGVDAVALNEFTGRAAVRALNLEEVVSVVPGRPLSIEGLHVVVHKDHPDASALLAMVEDGLATIRANGRYHAILGAHMSRIWSEF